ncbi:hypothetical protein [Companilactobacillus versmoldensis]|uniref:Uncharacterized protein n=1 Tax=Companilactobacillus versmoldensis DSM 14857 = KCTC 3814 TaxID=1423815 RepID=A0A0R1SCM8_9LACO|nr:hypothetical protein [Companilactobacillus versmoldensis]KRL66377.1 hypothetical protein FC27_GL000648 [Companilactobacillus versmoldensis DSM 14857 = KCTC 3814]
MAKSLRTTIRAFVYELCVLGVIYYGLVILKVMTKDFNYWALLIFLAVIFIAQWVFFYRKEVTR